MKKNDLLGDFRKIAPSKLVGHEPNEIEDFFLILAVIYNDLKGLMYLYRLYNENNPAPVSQVPSAALGERNGMTTQLFKLVAGMINEFLIFLKEHEHLYLNPQFQLILLKVPKGINLQWNDILDAAFERTKKNNKTSLGYKLMLIRNHVAFHYYQSEKVLRQSFKEFFIDKNMPGADHAYYSDGGLMQSTRFYFADAAVQRYLLKTASAEYQKDYGNDMAAYNNLQAETFQLIGTMNMVIANLLRQFIREKSKT
jgi:hypothetical protein